MFYMSRGLNHQQFRYGCLPLLKPVGQTPVSFLTRLQGFPGWALVAGSARTLRVSFFSQFRGPSCLGFVESGEYNDISTSIALVQALVHSVSMFFIFNCSTINFIPYFGWPQHGIERRSASGLPPLRLGLGSYSTHLQESATPEIKDTEDDPDTS